VKIARFVCFLAMAVKHSSNPVPKSAGLIGKWECLVGFCRFSSDGPISVQHFRFAPQQIQMSDLAWPGLARQCQSSYRNSRIREAFNECRVNRRNSAESFDECRSDRTESVPTLINVDWNSRRPSST
jgi:hypothetical protein